MRLPNLIGTGKVEADLDRRRDEAVPFGLADGDPRLNVMFPSEHELRTTLVLFADFGNEAGAGSGKFNVMHLDLFPESGIEGKHAFNLGTPGAEVYLSLIEEVWLKEVESIFHDIISPLG
jgi:hypothetical protein